MARQLTHKDAHNIINLIQKQAMGKIAINVVDSSTFVSAGELLLAQGTENVLNAMSIVMGKTMVSARPYKARLAIIQALNSGIYTNRIRKISFYSQDAMASGYYNTDLYTNLAPGFTAGENKDAEGAAQSTKSQFEQVPAIPLEMNFAGSSVWQTGFTRYEKQLGIVFRSEDELIAFWEGAMVEKQNDIEQQKEAFNNMTVLNKIGATYDMAADMPESLINLTKGFNDKFGTSYTSEELRTTYLKDFLPYLVSTIKSVSDRMTHRSALYHWSPDKTVAGVQYKLLRHTPKADQRIILYNPLFIDAEAMVLPEIFNDNYLKLENGERVDYWQSISDPAAVKVIPAIPDAETGVQKAGEAVDIPYVVGMIFDKDAMMTDMQLEDANWSQLEARKGYRTCWFNFAKNAINDQTFNTVLFIMKDGE